MVNKKKLKILILAAETAPIAKVGGLGDVIGALPKALDRLNLEAKLCLPFYGSINKKKYKIKKLLNKIKISVNNQGGVINIWLAYLPSSTVKLYLIEHKYFQNKEIYLSQKNMIKGRYVSSLYEMRRFAFFTRAALEAARAINFRPDIVHAHDWHAALAADFIKNDKSGFFKNTKTIYTIHNLANQGITAPQIIKFSQLNPDTPIIKADLKNGDINFMVQGILASDAITTVSPTYAKEILTHCEGAGLDNILKKRKKDLSGILNGIDTDFFNPVADKFIKYKYSSKTLDKKIKNKLALQKKLGLPQNKNMVLAGLISRFVWQKGPELFTEKFSNLNCQFVFLGTGDKKYEDALKNLEKKCPSKFKVIFGFNEPLAHQIYAGADIFLMPSRFEPCGLGQMIAMRYGTVPVVRATGGLVDTVKDFRFNPLAGGSDSRFHLPAKATGFVFKNFNSDALYNELGKALNIFYRQPKIWRQLQINGMKKDFSWNKSAKEYLKLYKKLKQK